MDKVLFIICFPLFDRIMGKKYENLLLMFRRINNTLINRINHLSYEMILCMYKKYGVYSMNTNTKYSCILCWLWIIKHFVVDCICDCSFKNIIDITLPVIVSIPQSSNNIRVLDNIVTWTISTAVHDFRLL